MNDQVNPSVQKQTVKNKLAQLALSYQKKSIQDFFINDPKRVENFSLKLNDIYVDLSKHYIDQESKTLLLEYAQACQLKENRKKLFDGEKINHTENRSVMHMALRARAEDPFFVDGKNVMPDVVSIRERCFNFAESVREGKWLGNTGKKIKTIVNIGIGGSHLGPQLVINALFEHIPQEMDVKFISRLDASHVAKVLSKVDPETTLFIIVSKTFTTLETIENAKACRAWLANKLGEEAVSKHFVAVSSNVEKATAFGINSDYVFGFWDWVGGRFSLWSSVGLSIMIAIGKEKFTQFLEGARSADQHFLNESFENNIPVMMGLLGVWYRNYFNSPAHAILSYDETLEILPNYLQQLDMESNGKSIDKDQQPLTEQTGPLIFGGLGNDGQHAYYQWLHQGTNIVPADFFAPIHPAMESFVKSNPELAEHHSLLLSNCFAQSQAMMLGKDINQVKAELEVKKANHSLTQEQFDLLVPYKIFQGNRPSTTFLYTKMTPEVIGTLLALYEHKIFAQGILWNINSFDQWGVELGKELAQNLAQLLVPSYKKEGATPKTDDSTASLIKLVNNCHK